MAIATEIFHLTKSFPKEEKYSLVDQVRRSSRSVCSNLAEAWVKRRYKAAFIAKLNDAEAEATETQGWIEQAERYAYMRSSDALRIHVKTLLVLKQIAHMIKNADDWVLH